MHPASHDALLLPPLSVPGSRSSASDAAAQHCQGPAAGRRRAKRQAQAPALVVQLHAWSFGHLLPIDDVRSVFCCFRGHHDPERPLSFCSSGMIMFIHAGYLPVTEARAQHEMLDAFKTVEQELSDVKNFNK